MKNQFLKYLKDEDYDSAESLLASDVFDVENQMDALTEEDYKIIEPHWSAVNTGNDITTPLFILKKIYDFINFEESVSIIDLGSGHGHPCLLFGALNPSLNISGYDIVLEKVNGANQSAKKLELNNVNFKTQDLSDPLFEIPTADYYYLFNPVNSDVADYIAAQLFKKKTDKTFKILSLGGRDIKSFKNIGFKQVSGLEEIGLEVLIK